MINDGTTPIRDAKDSQVFTAVNVKINGIVKIGCSVPFNKRLRFGI